MLLIQITAAQGPAECERAVAITVRALLRDAGAHGIALAVAQEAATPAGFRSVLLRGAASAAARQWLATWEGSVQCVFTSPWRPGHRRKNWFVGVQRCAVPEAVAGLDDGAIVYQACRASGKGGQHVNTTDSAVHALHVASGIAVKVMGERSQHANKRLARALIALKLAERQVTQAEDAGRQRRLQHQAVQRGWPVRVLAG